MRLELYTVTSGMASRLNIQSKSSVVAGDLRVRTVRLPAYFSRCRLLYLAFPSVGKDSRVLRFGFRPLIEALAVVTSLKYGLWAVTMIWLAEPQGDQLQWEHYMLIVSHLGMAVEGLLFVRFMMFGRFSGVHCASMAFAGTMRLIIRTAYSRGFLKSWRMI